MQKDRINEWMDVYQDSMKKCDGGGKEFYTPSGIPIKPIYTSEDLKDFKDDRELGLPGEYPYTRGVYHTMYRGRRWSKRFLIGLQSPEVFNVRQKEALEAGSTAINFLPCYSHFRGYDSDMVDRELLGRSGTTLDSLKDMEIAFDGIPIDRVSIALNDGSPFMLGASLIAMAEKRGIPLSQLIGTTNHGDFIDHYASCMGGLKFGMEGHLKILIDHVKYCTKNMPNWHPLSIVSEHYQDAGANSVQALAYYLAAGIFYVDAFVKAGLNVDDFAPRISFLCGVGLDLFEEAAKHRAARRMWAKIMKDRYGAKNPRSLIMKFHVHTMGSEFVSQQPINNIVRATIMTLAGVLGGAQSIHTAAYDEPLWSPTPMSQRIAIMTQHIIAEETGVADVIDPLGGSYYVESLTNEIEERAWEHIDRIEKMGGMFEAVKKGHIQKEIQKTSYESHKRVESGDKIVVGLNKYTVQDREEQPPEQVKVDPEMIERQLNRTRQLKKSRDQKKVNDALNRICDATMDPQKNVFEEVIEAVKALVTNGEIVAKLRDIYGFAMPISF